MKKNNQIFQFLTDNWLSRQLRADVLLIPTALDEAASPRVGLTDLFGDNVLCDRVAGKHLARVIG